MNFSTMPPSDSISSRARAKYGRRRALTSSGSAPSDPAVNPARSANRTETTFRSSAMSDRTGVEGASSGEPHAPQKRASRAFTVPQTSHVCARDAPQFVQNRWSASFVAEHTGQVSGPVMVGRV
jgi:hypothetical protein